LASRVDLSNASAVKKKSRFVPQDLLSRETYEITSAASDAFTTSWNQQWSALFPKPVTFQIYNGMTLTEATIFHRLRQLSFIRSQVPSIQDLDANALRCFTRNVLLIERHINVIVNWRNPQDSSLPLRCMPFYTSTLAFIYVVFREIPNTSSILGNFLIRLRISLGAIGLENFCEQFSPEFLLWLLFIGSWVAEGRSDRPWYLRALAWLTRRSGFCNWEQAKVALSGYCLVESVCEQPYRKLLEESRYGDMEPNGYTVSMFRFYHGNKSSYGQTMVSNFSIHSSHQYEKALRSLMHYLCLTTAHPSQHGYQSH
jgi:hypothetical protein